MSSENLDRDPRDHEQEPSDQQGPCQSVYTQELAYALQMLQQEANHSDFDTRKSLLKAFL